MSVEIVISARCNRTLRLLGLCWVIGCIELVKLVVVVYLVDHVEDESVIVGVIVELGVQ